MASKKNKAISPTNSEVVARADSYQEIFLNVGTFGDPTGHGGTGRSRLMRRTELDSIFIADGIGRRIVEIVPEEMFRNGFEVEGIDDMALIRSRWDEIDATNKLIEAFVWAALYGGSMVIMGIDDGGTLEDEAGEGDIEFLRVYDRYQVSPYLYEDNPMLSNYGQVVYWQISPVSGTPYFVHASRCYIIDGDRLPERMRKNNNGWGASCLQGVAGALKDFGITHQMATSLLARKQQGIWKIQDLSQLCQDKIGKGVLKERLNQVDMSRGNNNTISLDAATEDYVLLQGDLGGVTDVIQEKKGVIMMVTGIHESILTGENVSGINANENTALASFHQLIERKRTDKARPAVEAILRRMIKGVDSWKIKFNPLSIESGAQKSDRMQKESAADTAYVQDQILDEDEIRDTLRKRGDYVMKAGSAKPKAPTTTPEEDEEIINGNQS